MENANNDNQYLTFTSGPEIFGIEIINIKEIKEYTGVTSIPMMPDYIKGVINLRGNVVPILDLQIRFGRKASHITRKSCVIIIEMESDDSKTDLGLLVDSVNEVIDISQNDVEPAPSFGSKIRIDFIKGIGKVSNQFIIILDIKRSFSIEDLASLEQYVVKENYAI